MKPSFFFLFSFFFYIGLGTFRGAQLTSLVNCEHLALLICAGSGGSGSSSLPAKVVPPPAYMVERNAQGMDLTSLTAPGMRGRAADNALSNLDVLNGGWPEEALARYSTLDPAQRAAIKVRSLLLCLPHVILALPYTQLPCVCLGGLLQVLLLYTY